ncbi:phosphoribosyl-ATP diphosphatase [Enterococcus hirae]|uniref:phosphoribosyl-ATP diphosphatase n=1 Tax=Enterococcus hirae TaxID=1354 RepID=UPI000F4DBB47|nr:phosphoribosyl-ATP diphosphatase [Enterococcus hirae]EMF0182295.1 phosphoribosyl-ATP diphosphatase [Enterococcus hirae]EMF0197804.1 phosphoribosyl-ATP diphosphatase [Enterococcus hirae]MCL4589161.1 phosphoribosyl-ATP diphosphatase [Enterococcus hirae]MCV3096966.1 phosphoribosyl-ATP diphosphatase [Enterococcus hirae]MCV3124581.1 phosphoribosyl-ATP diphosphatase [Enterococcus hirae]
MLVKVKKINGEEFIAEVNQTIQEIYDELSNNLDGSFILFGERIEQKMTIESVYKDKAGDR